MALEDLIKKAQSTFHHQFGEVGRHLTLVAAPSRVTLLGGEYTEAVDGFSLVAAGNHWVVVAAQRRNDRQAAIHSLNYDEKVKVNLATLKFDRADGWANFPKGVLYFYERTGRKSEGIQMTIVSDIPENAGLGASAALSAATGVACNILGTQPLDDPTLVKLCQRVESQFIGGRGDYFSPFASKMGKKDHLVVFDARTFKPEYLPFDSKAYKLVVVDSGVKRKEREDEFKKRLELFGQLLAEIRKHVPKVISLRDVGGEAYEDARKKIDIILRKRLDHVVYENQRVKRAKDLMARGDYAGLGGLLNESHASLADKLKVTCGEVDILWGITQALPGCLGARMAGIGWGGHLVCLVEAPQVQAFADQVRGEYKKRVNINAQVYVYEPQDGA
ncbi:MAG TPA: galactokinase family protein, partial [bacterium]|nr:galactokinase family protein [bacterium]